MSSDNIKLLKENQKSIYPQTLSDAVLLEEDSDKTLLEHIEENFATKDEAANNTTMMNKVNVALSEFKEDVLEALNDVADTDHDHDQYALKDHKHDEYLTRITSHFHKYNDILFPDGVSDNETLKKEVEKRVTIDYFNEKINEKANLEHAHPEYADYDHSHDSQYASLEHDHDAYYSKLNHNHDELYMPINKTFDDKYSKKDHNHDYNDLINTPDIPTVETIKNSLDLDRYDEIIDNLAHLVNEVDNASKLNNVNIDKLQKDLAASANKEHTHSTEEIIVRPGNDDAGEAPIYLKEFLDTKADSSHVHNLEDLPNSILTIEKNKEILNSEIQFTHKHSLGDIVDLLEYPVDGGNDRLATHNYVDDAVIEGMSSIDYANITGLEERLQQTESIVADNTNSLTQMDISIRNELGEVISKNASDINDIVNILPKREQMEDEDYLEPIKLLKEIAPVDHHHEYEDLPADIVSIEKLDGYVKPYVESEFSSYTENVLEPTLNSKLEDYSTIDHIHEDIEANITSIESSISNIDNKIKTIEENNITYQEDITKKLEEYTLKTDFDDRINYIQTNFSTIEHNHDDMYALKEHEHDKYADKEDVYNKTEIDTTLDALKSEINIGAYATKEEVVQQLESKADLVHTHEEEFTSIDSQFQEIDEKFKEYTKSSDIEKMVENTVAVSLTNKVDKTTLDLNYQTTQVSDLKYAKIDHTHAYSPLEHNHDEKYSLKEHLHENTYYTQEFIKENYSLNTHKHDDLYSNINHSHDNYALIDHNHDDKYLTKETTFDDKYSKVDHKHEEYALKEEASKDHDHDDKYAKIEELAEKANIDHTHEEYAEKEHEHGDYIKSQDANEMFASKEHEHENYALAEHTHEDYLSISTAEEKYATKEEVEAKSESGHVHEEYATKEELKEYSKNDHLHEEIYAPKDHEHIIYADKEHTHEEYALYEHNHDDLYVKIEDDVKEHTHEEYALKEEVAPLEHDHDDKYALIDHTHEDYAVLDHEHTEYAIKEEVETMFDDKYASIEHEHEDYALKEEVAVKEHNHDDRYSLGTHKHDLLYAAKDHDHPSFDSKYAAKDHIHSNYIDNSILTNNYYNKSETDNALKSHNHDSDYYRKNETLTAAETELKIVKAELGITKDSIKEVIDETTKGSPCEGCDICQSAEIDEDGKVIKGVTISGKLAQLYTQEGANLSFNKIHLFERIIEDSNLLYLYDKDIEIPEKQAGDPTSYLVRKDLESNLILENDITGLLISNQLDEETKESKDYIKANSTKIKEIELKTTPLDDNDKEYWKADSSNGEEDELIGYSYNYTLKKDVITEKHEKVDEEDNPVIEEIEKNKYTADPNILFIFRDDGIFLGIRVYTKNNTFSSLIPSEQFSLKTGSPEEGEEVSDNISSNFGSIKQIIFKSNASITKNSNGYLVYKKTETVIKVDEVYNEKLVYQKDPNLKLPSTLYNEDKDTGSKKIPLEKLLILLPTKVKNNDDKATIENIYVEINGENKQLPNNSINIIPAEEETTIGLIVENSVYTFDNNNYTFNSSSENNSINFALKLGDDSSQISLDNVIMNLHTENDRYITFTASTNEEISIGSEDTQTKIKITEAEFAHLYNIVEQKVTIYLSNEYDELMEKLRKLEKLNILGNVKELDSNITNINEAMETLNSYLGIVDGEEPSSAIKNAFEVTCNRYFTGYTDDETGEEKPGIFTGRLNTEVENFIKKDVEKVYNTICDNLEIEIEGLDGINKTEIENLKLSIGEASGKYEEFITKIGNIEEGLNKHSNNLKKLEEMLNILQDNYLGEEKIIPKFSSNDINSTIYLFDNDGRQIPFLDKSDSSITINREDGKTPFYKIETERYYTCLLKELDANDLYKNGILTKENVGDNNLTDTDLNELPEAYMKSDVNLASNFIIKIEEIRDSIKKLSEISLKHIDVAALNNLIKNSIEKSEKNKILETALEEKLLPTVEEENDSLDLSPIVDAVHQKVCKTLESSEQLANLIKEKTEGSVAETQTNIDKILEEIDTLLVKFDTNITKSTDEVEDMIEDLNNNIEIYNIQLENLRDDIFGHVDNKLEKYDAQFQLEIQDFNDRVLEPKEILMANKIEELQSSMDDFNYSCDDKMSEFSERLTETEQSIEQKRTDIKDELTSLKDKYLEELDNKVEDLTDSIAKTEETLNMTLDEANIRISEVVSANIETVNNKVNEAQGQLETKKTEIEGSLQGKVEELTKDIEDRITSFGTEYEKAIGDFTDDYTNTISSFNEEVNKLYSEHETKLNDFSDDFTDSYETKISEFKSEVENLINTHDANLATSKAELETYIETEKAKIDESVTEKCDDVIEEANEIANKNIENITVISSDLQDIVSNAMVEYDEQISEKFNEVNDKIDQFEYQYQSNSDNLEYKIEEYDNKFKDYNNNINELSLSINSMIQESEKSINDTITNFDNGLNELIEEKTGTIDSKITEFTGSMNQTINDFREEHLINVSSLVAQKLDDFQYNVLDEFESEVDSRINEIPSVDLYKSVFDETVELKVNPVVESLKTMKEEDLEDMSKSISELTLRVEEIKSDAISDLIALDVMTKDMIQQWLAENPTAHSHSSVHIYASEEENVEGSPRAKYFYYVKSDTDNEIDESQRDYFDPSKIELEEYDPERKRLTIDKVYARKTEVTQKINSAKRQIYTDLETELADTIKENIQNSINDTIKAELNNTLVSNYARYNYDEFYQRDENGQIIYDEYRNPVKISVDSIENMMKCMKANASNHAHANYVTISELLNVGETSLINRNYYTKSQVDGRIQQKVDSSMTNLFNNKVNEIETNVTNNISKEIQNNYVLKSELESHLEEFNLFKDTVALKTHNHDTVYATKRELAEKANFTHNHDGVYAKAVHEHPEYAPAGNYVTKEEVENNMVLDGVYARIDSTYTKDVVYTKAETDALMSNYHADFLRKEDAYNKTDIDSLVESIREDINNVNQIPDNLYTKQEVLDLINSAVEHLHDDYTQRLSAIEERLANLEQ